LFTNNELKKKGWNVEQGKYNYACKTSLNGSVINPSKKQGPPPCKKKIKNEIIKKVEDWMIKNSTSSSEDSKKNLKNYKRRQSKEKGNDKEIIVNNNNNIFIEDFENDYFDISLLRKNKEKKNNTKEIRIVNETKKKL